MVNILVIEPGDEATRRPLLEGMAKVAGIRLVIASGVCSSAHGQWFEEFTSDFIPFQYHLVEEFITEACRRDINGVVTYFDLCLDVANQVARRLELPPIFDGEVSLGCKTEQRRLMAVAGLRNARHVAVTPRTADIASIVEYVGLPCIVKPAQLTSSLGVRLCASPAEVESAIITACSCDFWDEKVRDLIPGVSPDALVEEKLLGEEVSVEGFCFNGRYHPLGITKKLRSPAVIADELGHVFPHPMLSLDSVRGREIVEYVGKAHAALGVRNGFTHAEVMLGESGNSPVLVELNCRPGGGCIPVLIENALNVSVPQVMVGLALGLEPEIAPSATPIVQSTLFAYTATEGRLVRSAFSAREVNSVSGYLVQPLKSPGDFVFRAGTNEVTRCGFVLARGAYEAFEPMETDAVEPFLGVLVLEGRTVGFLWAAPLDLSQLETVEAAAWAALAAPASVLETRLRLNPRSTVMAVDLVSGECLGFLTQVPIPASWSPPTRTWSQLAALAVDPDYLSTHKSRDGLVAFGVSIASIPSAPRGLGAALFKTLKNNLHEIGCRSFIGGIRMAGLRIHLEQGGTMQTYLEGLRQGSVYNPIYGAVVEAGGRVLEPMPDYYGDVESKDFGLKIEIPSARIEESR